MAQSSSNQDNQWHSFTRLLLADQVITTTVLSVPPILSTPTVAKSSRRFSSTDIPDPHPKRWTLSLTRSRPRGCHASTTFANRSSPSSNNIPVDHSPPAASRDTESPDPHPGRCQHSPMLQYLSRTDKVPFTFSNQPTPFPKERHQCPFALSFEDEFAANNSHNA